MADLLGQVVFYGLAAALAAPVAAVVTALILGKSTRPVPSAVVFTAGAAALDALAAVALLWTWGGSFDRLNGHAVVPEAGSAVRRRTLGSSYSSSSVRGRRRRVSIAVRR